MSIPALPAPSPAETAAAANRALGQMQRPARALIGWMDEQQAHLTLCGRRADLTPDTAQIELVRAARAAVAARDAGVDHDGVVEDAPDGLTEHVAALHADATGAALLSQGMVVALVDLTRVRAAQPLVHVDHAEERAAEVDPDDLASIAAISLPLTTPTEIPMVFDETQKAYILSSANPNLRVSGMFQTQTPNGPGLGFIVNVAPSFLRVTRYNGLPILTDGYHRAHGFLKRGITCVPALVQDVSSFEALGLPAGMLSQETFLGSRPPVLPDYLDDDVSTDVLVPASQKIVMVKATEVSTLG